MKKLNCSVVEKLKSSFYLSTFLLFNLSTAYAAPLQWICDWPEAKSQTFSLYQGETATFEPTFRVNGRTVTNATIEAVWYQTNGMANAWWKLDGATFAPSNDVGAASYRFFVEAKASGDTIYRANGALRMLPSPGFTPNAIEPPIVTLDFSTIEVLNPPWTDPDYSTNNTALVATIEATAPAPGNYAAVSNAAMNAVQTETDPVWNAEKSDYATKADLSTGQITVNSAEYAESARDAYNADYATLAEGLRDGPTEIYANTIFARLNAATATNAQQTAAISSFSSALSNKLDKSGGTLSGGITVWGDSTFYGNVFSFSDTFKIRFMDAVMTPYFEIFGLYDINLPAQSGTLALVSDIPTTMAWSAITGKPTTISGYGITDALKSDFASLTNNSAFTSAVAAVSPPTDTSELEARGFVRIVADDEIYFVTITTTQTEE